MFLSLEGWSLNVELLACYNDSKCIHEQMQFWKLVQCLSVHSRIKTQNWKWVVNTCYLKFALCNLPHRHWTRQKWVWGRGLGLQNWWPLGRWSKGLSQKNLWHMQITILSWQQGGNLWTSIVYTMMMLKVFNEISMNFANF